MKRNKSNKRESESTDCRIIVKDINIVIEKQGGNMNKNNQPKKEAFKNNLYYGFEIAQKEYEMRLNRIRDVDNKLNMMLVIFAALLAALGLVVDGTVIELCSVKKILVAFTFFVLLFSIITIFVGLYPRKYQMISSKALNEVKTYDKDEITFAQDYLVDYSECIKSIEKIMSSKLLFLQISTISNVVAFILFIIIVIV